MKFYTIAKAETETTIYIMDQIGEWGTQAKDLIQDIAEITTDKINLHIDSPGGSITDGLVIYNALKSHPAEVDVYIDGIAASIASIIILAGDNIYIPENGAVMVHLPMISYMEGANRIELGDAMDLLVQYEKVLKGIYQRHTSQEDKTISSWFEKDTWFFGQDAVDAGLATQVVDKVKIAAKYDVAKYNFTSQHPAGEETNNNTEEKHIMEKAETLTNEVDVLTQAVESKDVEINSLKEKIELLLTEAAEKEQAQQIELEKELARKESIQCLAEKYDVESDLAELTTTALAENCSVDDFKDQILDFVAQRPTASAVKPSSKKTLEDPIASLREEILNESNPVKKNLLARKLRELR